MKTQTKPEGSTRIKRNESMKIRSNVKAGFWPGMEGNLNLTRR